MLMLVWASEPGCWCQGAAEGVAVNIFCYLRSMLAQVFFFDQYLVHSCN